jgi:hypothetical protein
MHKQGYVPSGHRDSYIQRCILKRMAQGAIRFERPACSLPPSLKQSERRGLFSCESNRFDIQAERERRHRTLMSSAAAAMGGVAYAMIQLPSAHAHCILLAPAGYCF